MLILVTFLNTRMEFVITLKDDPVTIQFVDGYVDEVGEGYNSPVVLQVTSRDNPASHKSKADLSSKVVKGICNKKLVRYKVALRMFFFYTILALLAALKPNNIPIRLYT